jgi:hypothetical protein
VLVGGNEVRKIAAAIVVVLVLLVGTLWLSQRTIAVGDGTYASVDPVDSAVSSLSLSSTERVILSQTIQIDVYKHAYTLNPFFTYLPAVLRGETAIFQCPTSSSNAYVGGRVTQEELDNPVRPAYDHADKNIALRSYTLNTDSDLKRELVDYGAGDATQPPQFATVFSPARVPELSGFYQVHNWNWAPSPAPGTRGDPIQSPPVTALGLSGSTGEALRVPSSGYDIGGGFEAIVLFADEDTVTLAFTRFDTAARGYAVHIDNICTDPNLLALYNSLDDPQGPRYVYVDPSNRPYTYDLPTLTAGQPIGTVGAGDPVVAIVDSGTIQDPRSCNEWWQVRPGYAGTCPPGP